LPLLRRQKGYLKAAKHLGARERWDRPNSQSGLASNHLAAAIHNIRFPYCTRTSFRLAYCEGREKERGRKQKGKKRKEKREGSLLLLFLCSSPSTPLGNSGEGVLFYFYTHSHYLLLPSNSLRFPFHSSCLVFFLAFLFVLFFFFFFFFPIFTFFSGRGGYRHYYTYSIYIYAFFPLRIVL